MNNYTVDAADADIRLDRWFKRHHPYIPHGWIEKGLRKGDIRLDGKKAKAGDRIKEGQKITFPLGVPSAPLPPKKKGKAPSENELKELKRAILFEDRDILIINKPAGLAVQGGSKLDKNLDDMLAHLGGERPRLVHRLDKDTSGVLLLAKSPKVAGELAEFFKNKTVEKIYVALVKGTPKPKQGTIDAPLGKVASGKDSYESVEVGAEDGKRAITDYEVIDNIGGKFSWVRMWPITGRTHQLRVHMLSLGCPIIGDGKYGGADAFVKTLSFSNKLHLHAERLVLNYRGKKIDVTAPWPKHMLESKKALEG